MNPEEAEREIRSRIVVTPQKVTIAKALVLDLSEMSSNSEELMEGVLRANAVELPRPVVLHESVDSHSMLVAVGNALSWKLAAGEAIWSLIHAGLLIPLADARGDAASVDWTSVVLEAAECPQVGGSKNACCLFQGGFVVRLRWVAQMGSSSLSLICT